MASSGPTRVIRSSGYAAAASDPYVRHNGSAQGKRPRGRGSWRGASNSAASSEPQPRGKGNPLARTGSQRRTDRRDGNSGTRGRSRGGPRGGKGALERKSSRQTEAPVSSGALNDDLDAYFQRGGEDDSSPQAVQVHKSDTVNLKSSKNKEQKPAPSVQDLDSMLDAYMAADNAATAPPAGKPELESAGIGGEHSHDADTADASPAGDSK